jgi:hypothetical protein
MDRIGVGKSTHGQGLDVDFSPAHRVSCVVCRSEECECECLAKEREGEEREVASCVGCRLGGCGHFSFLFW